MTVKFLWQNKQARASLITAALALLSIISLLLATFQVNAWFKNQHTHVTPGAISNFTQTVQYRTDADNWANTSAEAPIKLTVSANGTTTKPVYVRIQHTSISAAYLRVSVMGEVYNADTNTFLSQTDGAFTLAVNNTKWAERGDYLYYTDDFYSWDQNTTIPTASEGYSVTPVLTDEFQINVDTSKFSADISAYQDYEIQLYVHVDAVQPDRYQEFWGISALPVAIS